MNTNSKIAVAAGGIALSIFIILASLDAYAGSNLQFRPSSVDEFDWADLSVDVSMSVCNPTFMPTSFNKIYAQVYYKSTDIAEVNIWGSNIPANSAKDVSGRINVNGMNVFKIAFGSMMAGFAGQQVEYNPDDFNMYLKIEKPILGFIPYTFEKQFPASELTSFLEVKTKDWNCD